MAVFKTIPSRKNGGILVVDDNEINRDICAISLEHLNLPIYNAENGEMGLTIAKDIIPDIILLDIMMPIIDGFEMLACLKADANLKDIPVLMLTARTETKSIVKALDAGANDYLQKPFAEEELVARVKTLLRNRYLERRVKEDISDGARIQARFLTDAHSTVSLFNEIGIEACVYNKAHGPVSGDFFLTRKSDSTVSLFLGDSCGHGLSAALISMRIIGLLHQIKNNGNSPAAVLDTMNTDLCGLLTTEKFIAASAFAFTSDICTMSNAAQPYPLLVNNSGIHELVLNGLPLAMVSSSPYKEISFTFQQGDRLILYTDGIVESSRSDGEIFGRDRLISSLTSANRFIDCQEVLTNLAKELNSFLAGATASDDLTLLVLERK
ncbi:SpoIIE family protein phosphatase [Desulfosediminicola sp.]|uniref:SpoIIE family protein phosphatase n=1 Tax=Desulfosediminicola sp. TaxID=2886825 RepID=UPI003AF23BEC